MTRRIVAIVALAVVAVVVYLLWFRSGDGATAGTKDPARSAKVQGGRATDREQRDPAINARVPERFTLDIDPDGPLRLEGQVLDADGKGVGNAEVWITTAPDRSTTTDGDGSFVFENLVGKTYTLTASSGDAIGATTYKLTTAPNPVVVRIAEGAAVRVAIIDEDKKPIANAHVMAPSSQRDATSDKDGKATLKPVHPGWVIVQASAPGYATGTTFATIGSAGASADVSLVLRKGVAVSGRVVDENGKPVAKAHISPDDDWGGRGDSADTDTDGRFSFPVLAHGVHVLKAVDGHHAPATSSPFMVAEHPVTDVQIHMGAGGTIAGRVVDKDKKPVAFATVRVASGGKRLGLVSRTGTTGRDGAFEISGLPRHKVSARAETGDTASKLVDADLEASARVADLELVLDVSGTIKGVVVDDTGHPVPEVSVHAVPDVFGGATEEQLLVATFSSATTDGAGGFTISGLSDGSYKLWAARTARGNGFGRASNGEGTSAKTGDANVKVILPATGSLVAKLAIDGQTTPPKLATVLIADQAPTPIIDGAVSIKDLTPGNYDVTFRSADFAAFVRRDVQIDAGKPTDLGTITVTRGRKLSGTVVDSNGPVGGAKVKLGTMLFSAANQDNSDSFDDIMGLRTTVTDQDGTFTLIGVPVKQTTIIADHPDRGRSLGLVVPPGSDDTTGVSLTLRGYGSITGKVTSKGQPLGNTQVSEASTGGGPQASFVETASDGTFVMAKVPEGKHVLTAIQPGMMSMKGTSAIVDVVAGQPSNVVIDVPVGAITLTVQVKALANNKVDAAQVFLFHGTGVTFANGQDLLQGFFQSGLEGMKIWLGGAMPMPTYDELMPNDYTVCSIPITGNLQDPKFQQRIQENMENIKVYCKTVHVAPAPTAQTFVDELPAMTPLPPPPK